MSSKEPDSSPIRIIDSTIGGNMPISFTVLDSETPFLMLSIPDSSLSSIIELFTTLATTSIACMSGMPDDNRVDKVLVNLDVASMAAVFFLQEVSTSCCQKPATIPFLHVGGYASDYAITTAMYIYQYVCIELLKSISICVSAGSAVPLPSNIAVNVGNINTSMNITTATETNASTAGYTQMRI